MCLIIVSYCHLVLLLVSLPISAFLTVVYAILLFMLSPAVRLVGGQTPESGRVEIYYNRTWGTVCDDDWDLEDGHVVCRMLGYTLSTEVKGNAANGRGTGPIWLDEVWCNGNEKSINNCPNTVWGLHDCDHSEDASVTCLNITSTGKNNVVYLFRIKLEYYKRRICNNDFLLKSLVKSGEVFV